MSAGVEPFTAMVVEPVEVIDWVISFELSY